MIPAAAPAAHASTTLLARLRAIGVESRRRVGALVVLLGRYVTRPALRFVARSGLREVFSAVALFQCLVSRLLLEEVECQRWARSGGAVLLAVRVSSCAGKRY